MIKRLFSIILMFFTLVGCLFLLSSCTKNEYSLNLGICIADSRHPDENEIYGIGLYESKMNFLDILGIDKSDITNSAVSVSKNKDYCIAIIETENNEIIFECFEEFAKNNNILEYELRYFEGCVLFATGENAKDTCNKMQACLMLEKQNCI